MPTSSLPSAGDNGGQREVLGHQVDGGEEQRAEDQGQLSAAEKHPAEVDLDVGEHQDLAEDGAPLNTIDGPLPCPEAAEPPCKRGPSLTGGAQSRGDAQSPLLIPETHWEIALYSI